MSDYTFASAVDLARLIKSRKVSSVEMLEHYLARVDKLNSSINAVIAQK